jgi:hypothetical protein
MQPWKSVIIIGAFAAVGVLAAAAIASGTDRAVGSADRDAACSGSRAAMGVRDGTGLGRRGVGASDGMRAWVDTCGADPVGEAVPAALDAIRAQRGAEIQRLGGAGFGDGSGECTGEGAGYGGGQGRGSGW